MKKKIFISELVELKMRINKNTSTPAVCAAVEDAFLNQYEENGGKLKSHC